MKNFTLLVVAILSLNMLYAHNPHPPRFTHGQTVQINSSLPYLHNIISVANTNDQNNAERSGTDSASRLLAYAVYANNGATFYPEDSIYLTFTGSNGGDLYHTLKYTTGLEWYYDTKNSYYINSEKYLQTFDANDNISTSINQYWDSTNSSYINSYQYIYAYDANNNMTSEIEQTWDTSTSAWINGYDYIYTYDANNNELSEIYQNWNTTTSAWVNEFYYIYTYNSNNNETSQTEQDWNTTTSAWAYKYYYIYTYTGNNETAQIEQLWNSTTSAWVNDFQDIYSYTNKNRISDIGQSWDDINLVWDNSYKYTFQYNASNDDTTEANLFWNTISSAWDNEYKYAYTYDVNNNETSETERDWDTTTLAWVNSREYLYTYNTYNQITSEITSTWNIGGIWEPTTNDNEVFIYYQTYAAGIHQVAGSIRQINLYPNPSNNFVDADITLKQTLNLQLRLINALGQTVWTRDVGNVIQYQDNIPVSSLPDGFYLLQMVTCNGTESHQVIVTH